MAEKLLVLYNSVLYASCSCYLFPCCAFFLEVITVSVNLLTFLTVSQGDYLVHFMDISRDELAKRPEEISVEKLQVFFRVIYQ